MVGRAPWAAHIGGVWPALSLLLVDHHPLLPGPGQVVILVLKGVSPQAHDIHQTHTSHTTHTNTHAPPLLTW